MYTVYVLYSKPHDRLYIGMTTDLEQRMLSHNHLGKKGYTKRYRPWTLILTELYESFRDARQRELQLKTGQGRAWIRREFIV